MPKSLLTHVDGKGKLTMVDVAHKEVTPRIAIVSGRISGSPQTIAMIRENQHKKGDVLTCAQLAGIMAAKKTADLIPLCHQVELSSVQLEFNIEETSVTVKAQARTTHQTGVEMEAFTAASVALLTIYDMCKAVDRSMVIGDLQLEEKSGGKSGTFRRS